jgi:manganese/zinc/iron transport system permease protein
MCAMIVAPAAAARQWTDRLSVMVALAALFGALSGVGGVLLSSTAGGFSTGPTIVIVASLLVFLSLLLAPNRGLLARWLQQQRNRRQLRVRAVLSDLHTLALQHEDPEHAHDVAVLRAMSARSGGVQHTLETLAERDLVREVRPDHWTLTPAGRQEAAQIASGDEL